MISLHSLRIAAIALVSVALTSCAAVQNNSTVGIDADLIIRNVTAIDALEGKRSGVDIVVRDGAIIAVGGGASSYNASKTIDGTGQFVIPGLWDAHVHLTYSEGIDHTVFYPLALAHGVMYLRDTGGHLDALKEAREQAGDARLVTPDLFVSGPLIDGAERVYDGSTPSSPDLSVAAADAESAQRRVDELAAMGVDFVKAYEMLSPDAYRALVERARYRGLRVALHPPLSMSLDEVVAAGAGDIQHLRNIELGCAEDAELLHEQRTELLRQAQGRPARAVRGELHAAQRGVAIAAQDAGKCSGLIDAMRDAGMWQTPTLTVSTFATERLYAKPRWRETYALLPDDIGEGWSKRSLRFVGQLPSEVDIAHADWRRGMIARMRDAETRFLAGTDAPIGFLTPGASLHEELRLMVEHGLSPIQALEAATIAPAIFFGLESEQGAILPGMKADLILLRRDPLQDIRNTLSIEAIVRNGCLLDRDALNTLRSIPQRKNGERASRACADI